MKNIFNSIVIIIIAFLLISIFDLTCKKTNAGSKIGNKMMLGDLSSIRGKCNICIHCSDGYY